MDEQHFRLQGRPFDARPDLDSYVEGRSSGRALAYLRHAVLQGDSFVVLTGEAGTGKSMLVDKLLREHVSEAVLSARIAGRRLDAAALLASVTKAFRVPVVSHSADELRAGLQAFLATLTASGRRALLVVDDAQHLLPAALKELTELATLRSRREAPLQVVLAGRPELRATLQRLSSGTSVEPVFLLCEVGPLSARETRDYIEHRLRRAAPDDTPAFSDAAHERIHQATGGVPRAINQLCERLLDLAVQQQIERVGPELVDEASNGWRLQPGDAPVSGGVVASAAAPEAAGEPRRVAVRRAGRPGGTSRTTVVLVTVLVLVSLVAGVVHEYDGALADARLSSLAVATRAGAVAEPVAAVVAPVPVPVTHSVPETPRVAPAPEAQRLAAAAEALRVPPAAAEPNDWHAVPAPAPAPRSRRPASASVAELPAPEPAPVAGPCNAAVAALGLCDPARRP